MSKVEVQNVVYARGESGEYVKAIEIRSEEVTCSKKLTQAEVDELVRRLKQWIESSVPT